MVAVVDDAMGVDVPIGEKEAEEDVDEKGELAGDVEEEDLLGQASEEAKFHWSEERRVHCPYQNEMLPH